MKNRDGGPAPAPGFWLVLPGPDERGGEMWTYGPPGEPVLYESRKEAEDAALSLAEALQRPVAVFVAARPWRAVTVARFEEEKCAPGSKPSSGSRGTTRRKKSRGSRG